VPQPRGVLVRSGDRHCHGHNHDPGGHLHARLQVRVPSVFVLRPVLSVADKCLERYAVQFKNLFPHILILDVRICYSLSQQAGFLDCIVQLISFSCF
jgi:hypothetical protein